MTKSTKRGMIKYKSYLFKDKDPVIDLMKTEMRDAGVSYKEMHENSGVSVSTFSNWFDGEVKRPQFATCQAAMRGIGREFVIKKR